MSAWEEFRGLLVQRFEKSAQQIGLKNGTLRITIYDARAAKVEASQHVRTCCVHRRNNKWVASDSRCELKIAQISDLVTSRLETLMASFVGRFGYVEATLEKGRVVNLTIDTSYLPEEIVEPPPANDQRERRPPPGEAVAP